MSLILERAIGVEMEGYINHFPRDCSYPNAELQQDLSLRHGEWNRDYTDFGIEIACHKTKNVQDVIDTFEHLKTLEWHVDNKAGTHIHVGAEDFQLHDRARALMFATMIQPIMHMFVKDYRYGNRYCKNVTSQWGEVFDNEKFARLNWKHTSGNGGRLVDHIFENSLWSRDYGNDGLLHVEKYFWMNACTNYPTIEFRLFHAIEDAEDIVRFAKIAHNTVDLIKYSTVEHLKFIALSIWEGITPEDVAKNFLEVIGLKDEHIPIAGELAGLQMLQMLTQKQRTRRQAV